MNDRDKKINLVVSDLYSNYIRKKPTRVSPYQIINRLLILFQKPLIFLFYKIDSDNNYKLIFYTHRDVFFRVTFSNNILKKYHDIYSKNKVLLKENSELKPVEIGNTGYFYLLVDIHRDIEKNNKLSFSMSENTFDYELLKNFWDEIFNSSYLSELYIQQDIKISLSNLENIKDSLSYKKNKEELLSDFELQVINSQNNIINSIVEGVYKKFSHSKLISHKDKSPNNIFFYIRYYTDNKERYEYYTKGYSHSLRMLIPETQKEDIKKGFENLFLHSYINIDDDFFIYIDPDRGIEEKNSHFLDSRYKYLFFEYFIRTIKENKSKCLSEIIDILSSSFTKKSRALVDAAIISGFIHSRSRLLREPLLDRLTPDLIEDSKKINDFEYLDNEVKKVIVLHYFLSISSSESTIETLSGLFIPVRLSAKSYLVIGKTYISNTGDLCYSEWLKNYHFYSTLVDLFFRKFRVLSGRRYIVEACKLYKNYTYTKLVTIKENKTNNLNLVEFNNDLEKLSFILCKVWSFDRILIYLLDKDCKDDKEIWNKSIKLLDGTKFRFWFKIKKNKYFVDEYKNPLKENSFISEDEVRNTLLLYTDILSQELSDYFKGRIKNG